MIIVDIFILSRPESAMTPFSVLDAGLSRAVRKVSFVREELSVQQLLEEYSRWSEINSTGRDINSTGRDIVLGEATTQPQQLAQFLRHHVSACARVALLLAETLEAVGLGRGASRSVPPRVLQGGDFLSNNSAGSEELPWINSARSEGELPWINSAGSEELPWINSFGTSSGRVHPHILQEAMVIVRWFQAHETIWESEGVVFEDKEDEVDVGNRLGKKVLGKKVQEGWNRLYDDDGVGKKGAGGLESPHEMRLALGKKAQEGWNRLYDELALGEAAKILVGWGIGRGLVGCCVQTGAKSVFGHFSAINMVELQHIRRGGCWQFKLFFDYFIKMLSVIRSLIMMLFSSGLSPRRLMIAPVHPPTSPGGPLPDARSRLMKEPLPIPGRPDAGYP